MTVIKCANGTYENFTIKNNNNFADMLHAKPLSFAYALWSECIATNSIPPLQFFNMFYISTNRNNMCYIDGSNAFLSVVLYITQDLVT